ncbi:MAG: flagellar protein FliL [Bdellovibrio sp.]|nr:MAG: flagellar protein FliL [Bdellovibrio sp.]
MAEEQGVPTGGIMGKLPAILTASFAVLNLLVTGAGAYLVYVSTLGYEAPSIREEELAQVRKLASEAGTQEGDQPLVYTMDKMTLNLAGEPKRLMQIEVNLEMLNRESFEQIMDVEARAKVRDRVLSLLGEQTFDEIEPIQGKLFLKDRLAREINSMLEGGVVKNVFFSEFVVQ